MTEAFRWTYADRDYRVPFDIVGDGERPAVLLPALSSVSTRLEMAPLASCLARLGFRCRIFDWPGFGDQPRLPVALSPASMQAFLDALINGPLAGSPGLGVSAGHGATHLLAAAGRHPQSVSGLALVAPTWRGPLPTAMGEARRPLYRRIRSAIEAPGVGTLLYRANVSKPIVRKMLQEHVYADARFITADRLAAKISVTRQPRARFATAAFVTGALDPVRSREEYLALFAAAALPPRLVLRPRGAPTKSGAEMDAVRDARLAECVEVPGALAAHEEFPDAVAAAIGAFVNEHISA